MANKKDEIAEHIKAQETLPSGEVTPTPTVKGSVITMKGVSGKDITSSVVIVKKAKPKPVAEEEKTLPEDRHDPISAEEIKPVAEPVKENAAEALIETSDETVVQKVNGHAEDNVRKTADKPVIEVKEINPAIEEKAEKRSAEKVTEPEDRSIPESEPADTDEKTDIKVQQPGRGGFVEQRDRRQGGAYTPGQRIQTGNYTPGPARPQNGQRPQTSPRPQNSGSGFRPQSQGQGYTRPQGGQGQGYARPQGGQGQGYTRPQGGQGRPFGTAGRPPERRTPAIDEPEVIFKDPSKNSFVQREVYDKNKNSVDKKDNKVSAATKPNQGIRDKHNKLKKQTSILPTGKVSQVLQDDSVFDSLISDTGGKSRFKRNSKHRGQQSQQVKTVLTHVVLPEVLTVKELSEAIKKTSGEVIKKLMKFGVMATLNQEVDFDTASIILEEFNITAEKAVVVTEEDILFDDSEDKEEDLITRPPVVVVMGHVDHGKTSLLDKIRSASVVTGEAGGITQHIGAYTVRLKDRNITFLDTPGHEAFTTMRARGAQVTDIAILVVAADDGVMPQTIEAINHAKAADVKIIVAINKIDKPGANPDRVKQELTEYGLVTEEWGGDNIMVSVSALTGENIDELLEMVLLTADIMDLKSNPDKQAKGTVIEAKLDKSRGPIATVLVQRGTLKTGDTLVTGSIIGRVRAMLDDKGERVNTAGPSVPVEITGLPDVPDAGEIFYAVEDEKVAKSLAERRRVQEREQQLKASSRMSLDTLFLQMAEGVVKELNLIVKADVQGSVEAVTQSLQKLTTNEVRVNVIHGAVGTVTESDLRLAEVSNAIVIGFNVRPTANVAEMATDLGIDIRLYRIIYQAIEEIEAAMKGLLDKKYKEAVLGHVEIRQVFKVSGVGSIGGGYVTDGKIIRSCQIRLLRDGVIVHEGKLASLKRFKDDVREVASGYECGLSVDKFNDIKEGDVIEAFEMQEIPQE
ncbi:MAG: translation initiation factor IF-2 [Eubacteriales bacterium]|nr:translation initiation factor IF-2 [Eubacteriales bacterium]